MLKLPDDEAVTLELVYDAHAGPVQVGGFSHLVVQVEELDTTLAALSQAGLSADPPQHPAGPNGPYTAFLTDPHGYRIELVEWPPGHTGITAADLPDWPSGAVDSFVSISTSARMITTVTRSSSQRLATPPPHRRLRRGLGRCLDPAKVPSIDVARRGNSLKNDATPHNLSIRTAAGTAPTSRPPALP